MNSRFPNSPCHHSVVRLTMGPGLLATYGTQHKKQRKMLNPVFSGAHMRNLTPLFYEVAGKVASHHIPPLVFSDGHPVASNRH